MSSRDTRYKEKYIAEVDRYLQINRDRTVKVVKTLSEEKGYKTYDNKLKVKLPTVEGFATYLGVTKKTLWNWQKENPEFDEAVDKIMVEQKQRLVNMGLSGEYNSTIAKLMLSHNHGMVERTDIVSKVEQVNTFNDEQINKIAERINGRRSTDGSTSGTKESD